MMNWEENLVILKNIDGLKQFDKDHDLSYKFYEVVDSKVTALLYTPYGTPIVLKLQKDSNEAVKILQERGCIECAFGPKHWIRSV